MHAEGVLLHLFWLLARFLSPQHASATGRILIRWLGPGTHKHGQVKKNLELASQPARSMGVHETALADGCLRI